MYFIYTKVLFTESDHSWKQMNQVAPQRALSGIVHTHFPIRGAYIYWYICTVFVAIVCLIPLYFCIINLDFYIIFKYIIFFISGSLSFIVLLSSFRFFFIGILWAESVSPPQSLCVPLVLQEEEEELIGRKQCCPPMRLTSRWRSATMARSWSPTSRTASPTSNCARRSGWSAVSLATRWGKMIRDCGWRYLDKIQLIRKEYCFHE